MNFKDPAIMLPSEMADYIKTLHKEIEGLNDQAKHLSKPDLFLSDDNAHETEEDLLGHMEIGDIVEAVCVKKIEQSFLVKVSKHRIDRCATRIEAEHIAMLHSV